MHTHQHTSTGPGSASCHWFKFIFKAHLEACPGMCYMSKLHDDTKRDRRRACRLYEKARDENCKRDCNLSLYICRCVSWTCRRQTGIKVVCVWIGSHESKKMFVWLRGRKELGKLTNNWYQDSWFLILNAKVSWCFRAFHWLLMRLAYWARSDLSRVVFSSDIQHQSLRRFYMLVLALVRGESKKHPHMCWFHYFVRTTQKAVFNREP